MDIRNLKTLFLAVALVCLLAGCSSSSAPAKEPEIVYTPAFRKLPPEPVYSRLTWSHLPEPIPGKSKEKPPYLWPVISVDLADATLAEALDALTQTIGYQSYYPVEISERKVSLKMRGTVEEILSVIAGQVGVVAELNHTERMVRVVEDIGLEEEAEEVVVEE